MIIGSARMNIFLEPKIGISVIVRIPATILQFRDRIKYFLHLF